MSKTISEIHEIRAKKQKDLLIRTDPSAVPTKEGGRMHILVCGGTGCTSSNSLKIMEELEMLIRTSGMQDDIKIVKTGCFGLCAKGPIVMLYPDHIMYTLVQPEDVNEIFDSHVKNGIPVKRLLAGEQKDGEITNALDSLDFFSRQMRIALRNCGAINPEDIDEYIARDGYLALEKVLTEMEPEDVIDEIKASGLRGRGGGGFPTGVKWSFAAAQQEHEKYVCCNADEGDPGAFMDRSVLEGDPHSVIEAMIIAGYAIGASQGYIYVRAEYPIAVERLDIAIRQAREYGLLGEDILGKGFNFNLELRLGAGAFVCGEETALMTSVEGKAGRTPAKASFSRGKRSVWKTNDFEQCRNLRQHTGDYPWRCPMVFQHWNRKVQRHKSICHWGQNQQYRSCGNPHGHHTPGNYFRYRRRYSQWEKIQGGADRRPVRRLYPRIRTRYSH